MPLRGLPRGDQPQWNSSQKKPSWRSHPGASCPKSDLSKRYCLRKPLKQNCVPAHHVAIAKVNISLKKRIESKLSVGCYYISEIANTKMFVNVLMCFVTYAAIIRFHSVSNIGNYSARCTQASCANFSGPTNVPIVKKKKKGESTSLSASLRKTIKKRYRLN